MAMIDFDRVSKGYHLGPSRTSLRDVIPEMTRTLFKRNTPKAESPYFWALKEVSFRVEEGEVLGIIGHNGAGKSTVLKLLSRVTYPTSGSIQTRGRMAALIELGAGFHPDLTGRENVYLNGSILGLHRREIDAAFAEIVEFAGLEKFIDTPVKRYSSGMYVRLAFSVAAHVRAELLLVDEVLSVGDMAFQIRCLAKMNELRDNGATVVFISHNLMAVNSFCKRVILLEGGQVADEGKPDEVIQKYRDHERAGTLQHMKHQGMQDELPVVDVEKKTVIDKVELRNLRGEAVDEFDANEPLVIRCHYHTEADIEEPQYAVRIRRADGLLCTVVVSPLEFSRKAHHTYSFEVCLGPLYLQPDYYSVQVMIADKKYEIIHAAQTDHTFRLKGSMHNGEMGVIEPEAEWRALES